MFFTLFSNPGGFAFLSAVTTSPQNCQAPRRRPQAGAPYAARALFVIDRQGIIRALLVSDINRRPDLQWLADAMEKVNRP